jgi:probable blue pigment (indigoidine) exporter
LNRTTLTLTTAIAPALWGTTYITTTALLPAHHPLFTATMRSLPVGVLIVLYTREIPRGSWWWRSAITGLLNIGLCFPLLFIGVYRLPGGVAATIGSIQPLLVALLGWPLLALRPARATLVASFMGILGVGLLVLGGAVHLDAIGLAASAGAAVTVSTGTVLTKRWGQPAGATVLAYTGWQLTAGGLLLTPLMFAFEGPPSTFTPHNALGYLYLCLFGTALAYTLWFRGVGRLSASSVTFLNLLIPIVASVAGLVVYHQTYTVVQLAGIAVIVMSIVSAQRTDRAPVSPASTSRPAPQIGTLRGACANESVTGS